MQKDTEITREQLFDSLGYLIVNKKKSLIDIIRKSNIEISNNANEVKIANVIIDNSDNEILQQEIATLISSQQENYSNIVPIIAGIATAIGFVFKSMKSIKESKTAEDEAREELIRKALEYKKQKEEKEKSNTVLYIVMDIVVIGGLLATFLILKRK